MEVTRDILEFCQESSISLIPKHLSGNLNTLDERQSRLNAVGMVWSLDSETFQWLSLLASPFQVELSATRNNAHLPAFVSLIPDSSPYRVVPLLSQYWGNWVLVARSPPVCTVRMVFHPHVSVSGSDPFSGIPDPFPALTRHCLYSQGPLHSVPRR